MPQGMTLWVNGPTGYLFAVNIITEPTQTPYKKGGNIQLCNPLSRQVLGVYIILVHSRNAEEAQDHIVHLKANFKTSHRMNSGKNSTIEEEEDGHCTAIVPIWGVEDIHVKEHLPNHRSLIALLLPGNIYQTNLQTSIFIATI